jgi:hypothetical protein
MGAEQGMPDPLPAVLDRQRHWIDNISEAYALR